MNASTVRRSRLFSQLFWGRLTATVATSLWAAGSSNASSNFKVMRRLIVQGAMPIKYPIGNRFLRAGT